VNFKGITYKLNNFCTLINITYNVSYLLLHEFRLQQILAMMYSEQVMQLLTLGEPEETLLNYSSLGFDSSHEDELIHMAIDPDLLNSDENSPEFWSTVHAWNALGQLKVTEAIPPLLDLREKYPFDLLFDQELPKAIAMMGEVAIPELKNYLFNENRDEITRSYALSCLEKIGIVYRQECLSVITELLQKPKKSSRSLIGLAICVLIKLKATETIDVIQDVFNRDCVDITVPGDLEDVEIALGLRFKRDTPKPNYSVLSPEITQAISKLHELDESERTQSAPKVGRNDPCPCGSGKKYKKCCLH